MKIFSFVGFYELPEDFKGNIAEALRSLADYHESVAKVIPKKFRYRKLSAQEGNVIDMNELWGEFCDALEDRGAKLVANVSIQTLKNNKWVQTEGD